MSCEKSAQNSNDKGFFEAFDKSIIEEIEKSIVIYIIKKVRKKRLNLVINDYICTALWCDPIEGHENRSIET